MILHLAIPIVWVLRYTDPKQLRDKRCQEWKIVTPHIEVLGEKSGTRKYVDRSTTKEMSQLHTTQLNTDAP